LLLLFYLRILNILLISETFMFYREKSQCMYLKWLWQLIYYK
jgi:hypothetical protein